MRSGAPDGQQIEEQAYREGGTEGREPDVAEGIVGLLPRLQVGRLGCYHKR